MCICYSFFCSEALIERNAAAFISLKNTNILVYSVSRKWTSSYGTIKKEINLTEVTATAGRTNIPNKMNYLLCSYISRLKNLWKLISDPLKYLEFSLHFIIVLLSSLNSGFNFKTVILFSLYFVKLSINKVKLQECLIYRQGYLICI